MKFNNGLSFAAAIIILSSIGFSSCSNDAGFGGGTGGNIAWSDGGSIFNGGFGWNDSNVTQTGLVGTASCGDYDNFINIINGRSEDPCAYERNSDGTPFTGTIVGTVCNTDNDTQTAHTVTCGEGSATSSTQEVSSGPTPTPTPSPTPHSDMIVFQGPSHDANLGGRTGADALCAGARPSGVTHTKIRALISISATDQIVDMPTNYAVATNRPLLGTNATVLANDWTDLLDGTIQNSLSAIGFTSSYAWSGSKVDGTYWTINGFISGCANFTSNVGTNPAGAVIAQTNLTGSFWLGATADGSVTVSDDCNASNALICIAYDDY